MSLTRRSSSTILSFLERTGLLLGPMGEKAHELPFLLHRLHELVGDSGSGMHLVFEM